MKKKYISLLLPFSMCINIFANNLQNNNNEYANYLNLLDKSCKENNYKSCHNLAIEFYIGTGIKQDFNIAFTLFNKACKGKFLESCFNVGVMSENGEGIKKDEFLAYDMYRLTCYKDKKNRYIQNNGCPNLALLYIDGRGTKQDYKKGVEILDNSCKAGFLKSCKILTKIYKDGYLGIQPKQKQHIELLEFLCKKPEANYCYNLATELFIQQDNESKNNSILYLKKACDLKHIKSCLELGVLYTNGEFVKQNLETAKEYFGKACDLRDEVGCKSYKVLNSNTTF